MPWALWGRGGSSGGEGEAMMVDGAEIKITWHIVFSLGFHKGDKVAWVASGHVRRNCIFFG